MSIIPENSALQLESDDMINGENIDQRFVQFSKKYIFYDYIENPDFIKRIKENAVFNTIDFSEEISERFVYYKSAPYFMILESPELNHLRETFKIYYSKLNRDNQQNLIKDFFTKWVTTTRHEEKKYFASSVIEYLEQNKNNPYNLIVYAFILGYDNTFYSPTKAIEYVDKGIDTLKEQNIDELTKHKIFYLFSLVKGFVFLKQGEILSAKDEFQRAIDFKSDGLSAKYHLALANVLVGNYEEAVVLISQIMDYDSYRFAYAVETNDLTILDYLFRNSLSRYFCVERAFAPVMEFFQNRVDNIKGPNTVRFERLKLDYLTLKNMKINKYYDQQIADDLNFIARFTKKYYGTENILILQSLEQVIEKFYQLIKRIITIMEDQKLKIIAEKLAIYEVKILDLDKQKAQIEYELDHNKKRTEEKQTHEINFYEESMNSKIKKMEDKVKFIDHRKELDPISSFKNSFTYNIMIAIIVMLLGGFSGYSGSYIDDIANFNSVFSMILVYGAKWGVVSFLIGLVFSIGVVSSVMVKKGREKQALLRKITQLNEAKESGKAKIRSEYREIIEELEDICNKRIKSFVEQKEEMIQKRQEEEAELKSKAQLAIKVEKGRLVALLKENNG